MAEKNVILYLKSQCFWTQPFRKAGYGPVIAVTIQQSLVAAFSCDTHTKGLQFSLFTQP